MIEIKRGFRFPGDYEYATDFIDSVEANNRCGACVHSLFSVVDTMGFTSIGCPIAEKVLSSTDRDEMFIEEWTEVRPMKIKCSAFRNRTDYQDEDSDM